MVKEQLYIIFHNLSIYAYLTFPHPLLQFFVFSLHYAVPTRTLVYIYIYI